MNVLIIEDDKEIAAFIHQNFIKAGHQTEMVCDGQEGFDKALTGGFDVLVVDRMLPSKDGLSIIADLRAKGVETPIIILSALGEVDDRIKGLTSGGDDYLTKPFEFAELLVRSVNLYERQQKLQAQLPVTEYHCRDLRMDLLTHRVYRNGQEVVLQTREFKLLEYLLKNVDKVVTRTMLLENVWEYNFDPQTNIIDVHISRLRQKLSQFGDDQMIDTVRGSGYILR